MENEKNKNEIEEAFNLAVAKQKEGDLEQAEILYRNILSEDERHPASNHNLGTLLLSAGKISEALIFFSKALVYSPLENLYWKNYIYCLWMLSASGKFYPQFQEAIEHTVDTAVHYIKDNFIVPDFSGRLGNRLEGLNFLLLGTCQMEFLANFGKNINCNIDHFLFESLSGYSLQSFKESERKYDAVVVGLSFRHILGEAVSSLIPDVSPDLFFTRDNTESEINAVLDKCKSLISLLIGKIKISVGETMPIFFISFMEPALNYRGYYSSRFDYNDPRYFFYKINEILYNSVKNSNNLFFIDNEEITGSIGKLKIQDDSYNHLTHAGYTGQEYFKPEFNIALYVLNIWNRIIGEIKVLRKIEQIKLIIVDLDNTLWKGIAADEEVESGVRTEGWPLGFVEALLFFKKRGGVIAVCSKNDPKEGKRLFNEIWGGRLSLNDFVSVKINWNDKSRNISEIIRECNILPESVLFLDDNPREIDEVKVKFPGMRFLTSPQLNWRRVLTVSPETQNDMIITEESKNRTALIKSKIERDKIRETGVTPAVVIKPAENGRGGDAGGSSNGREDDGVAAINEEWLSGLNLIQSFHIIKNLSDKYFPRAKELLNKTNQFNTTGKRRDEADLDLFFKDCGIIISTFVKDRLMDNGLVGLILIKDNVIEQAVLSCRVFGLGIEQALLSYALELILKKYDFALAYFKDTGKNFTCRDYFKNNGFTREAADEAADEGGNNGVFKIKSPINSPLWIKIEL
ncbi:MAG: HAD-IIIC family phosphatase [bacterium]